MPCSKCGSQNTVFKKGVSKAGKPYSGYKCQECDNMDFIREKSQPRAISAPNSATSNGASNGKSTEAMILAYAKDIVVAEIAKGKVDEPFKRVSDGFRVLLNAYNHPFGAPKPTPTPSQDTEEAPF